MVKVPISWVNYVVGSVQIEEAVQTLVVEINERTNKVLEEVT